MAVAAPGLLVRMENRSADGPDPAWMVQSARWDRWVRAGSARCRRLGFVGFSVIWSDSLIHGPTWMHMTYLSITQPSSGCQQPAALLPTHLWSRRNATLKRGVFVLVPLAAYLPGSQPFCGRG